MEAISALLFLLFSLCALLNSLFFRPSKLLPWLRSFLLSAASPLPSKHPDLLHRATGERREISADPYLRSVFTTFDSDGDGFISEGELVESLRRLGLGSSSDEVRGMMERADANEDGLIDFDEFQRLCSSWESAAAASDTDEEELLREAFAVFDGNGDGLITVEELGLVLKSLGMREGERNEACMEMIKNVDLDGDGKVNFEEFRTMMMLTQ